MPSHTAVEQRCGERSLYSQTASMCLGKFEASCACASASGGQRAPYVDGATCVCVLEIYSNVHSKV